MVHVSGIGGFFFRASNPAELAEWYERHFEILKVPEDYNLPCWRQDAGPTVFAPFDEETGHFGKRERSWMINFRINDIDRAVRELRQEGIVVDVDPEIYPNGRFARLADPEGNPIQLWQPDGTDG